MVTRPSPLDVEIDPVTHQSTEISPYQAAMAVIDRDSGIVQSLPQRKRVVIVGGGRTRRHNMDVFEDERYEVWGINAMPSWDSGFRFRADRWFELHPVEAQTTGEMKWLRECPVPFYMFMPLQKGTMSSEESRAFNAKGEDAGRDGRGFIDPRDCDLTPMLVRYPLNRARAIRDYFTCTFAYQIALAMLDGFEEIYLTGVDLALGTQRERTVERACVEWWMAYAIGKGIKVHYPPGMALAGHPYLYGASYWTEAAFTKIYCETLLQQEIAR